MAPSHLIKLCIHPDCYPSFSLSVSGLFAGAFVGDFEAAGGGDRGADADVADVDVDAGVGVRAGVRAGGSICAGIGIAICLSAFIIASLPSKHLS